jgi:uncharacterized MAPEG superfamily protein
MTLDLGPSFVAYAATVSFLSLQMVLVDAYSGVVRVKSKTTLNREDVGTVSSGAELVGEDPDPVARVMRAHRNLLANGIPFAILGLVWVLFGADRVWAFAVFGTFVAARLVHSVAYIAGKQPWRTLSFVLGQAALATMLVQIVRSVVAIA